MIKMMKNGKKLLANNLILMIHILQAKREEIFRLKSIKRIMIFRIL